MFILRRFGLFLIHFQSGNRELYNFRQDKQFKTEKLGDAEK